MVHSPVVPVSLTSTASGIFPSSTIRSVAAFAAVKTNLVNASSWICTEAPLLVNPLHGMALLAGTSGAMNHRPFGEIPST